MNFSWLLYDGHGNVVRTVNTSFTLSAYQWRGVWGEVQGNLALGRGYCANLGHPEDETGLVYMRARYYEPTTGRFISEDPAQDGGNWFVYANKNPVNFADQTGKIAQATLILIAEIAIGIVILAGLGASAYEAFRQYRQTGTIYSWERVALKGLQGVVFAIAAELAVAGAMALFSAGGLAAAVGIIFAIEWAVILAVLWEISDEAIDKFYPEHKP